MGKSIEERYNGMTRDDVIKRCEMYRKQLGGMSRNPNMLKQENKDLKYLITRLFDEYVESHTHVGTGGVLSVSKSEYDILTQFESKLDRFNIKHSPLPRCE